MGKGVEGIGGSDGYGDRYGGNFGEGVEGGSER